METRLSSSSQEIIIGGGRPTVLIGERINPTGKKKLTAALQTGEMEPIKIEALGQVAAGADMLDVNVGAMGIDQISILPQAVQHVMKTVDVPLCIDTDNLKALDAALKVYKGKALVNSVTGEERSLGNVLPVVRQYGAAVIGLVQDEKGIPTDSARRVAIARKIVERAEVLGIHRADVVIDCLALAIGADNKAGLIVLDTVHRIKDELGVNTTMGASNVSFGMPDRELLNSAFIATAIAAGATCLVVDVAKVRSIVLAVDLILGRDPYAGRYIKAYRKRQNAK
jgi:5-methyltetrahydrofolate--homocysteine methyltransferase